jgi:hypothetical protein
MRDAQAASALTIADLPPPLLSLHILAKLSPHSLSICSCVCKSWRHTVTDARWAQLFAELWSLPADSSEEQLTPPTWQRLYAARQLASRCWLGRPALDKLMGLSDAVKACCLLQQHGLVFAGERAAAGRSAPSHRAQDPVWVAPHSMFPPRRRYGPHRKSLGPPRRHTPCCQVTASSASAAHHRSATVSTPRPCSSRRCSRPPSFPTAAGATAARCAAWRRTPPCWPAAAATTQCGCGGGAPPLAPPCLTWRASGRCWRGTPAPSAACC